MLKSTNVTAIQESADAILILNKDKDICNLAKEREEAEMDYYSGLLNAEAKGRAEGKAEAYAELIAGWKAKGMTDEEIQKLLPTN